MLRPVVAGVVMLRIIAAAADWSSLCFISLARWPSDMERLRVHVSFRVEEEEEEEEEVEVEESSPPCLASSEEVTTPTTPPSLTRSHTSPLSHPLAGSLFPLPELAGLVKLRLGTGCLAPHTHEFPLPPVSFLNAR